MDKPELTVPELNLTFGLDMEAPTKRASLQRRSSLFKIMELSAGTQSSPPKKTSKSTYEHDLTVEAKQWHALIKDSYNSNSELAKDPLKVTHNDLGIELRAFVNAAPDFQQFQSDSLQFAKLAEFFVFRIDDLDEKQTHLRTQLLSNLQQSTIDLSIQHHLILPRAPLVEK